MEYYITIGLLLSVVISLPITYNIFPNENIFLNSLVYDIEVQGENFDEKNVNGLNIELLKEIKLENQQPYEFNGKEKLFSLNLNENDDDIDIMLLNNRSIECLYLIKNYIQDDEIIMRQNLCQIKLNYSDCFQLHKFDQQIYIVQCRFNQNNTILQILNQSQVFDEIIIPIQWQCQSDSILNKQFLIVFNKQCQTTILYSIQIINLSFTDFLEYDLTQIKGFSENNQQITDVLSNTKDFILIIYTNEVWNLQMKQKNINLIYKSSKFNIKKLLTIQRPNTKHIILENEETNQLFFDSRQLNISSKNFQNVFNFRKIIYLFQYTDKLLIKIENYQKSLPINTNNLIQVGKLPYFLVQKNQQIILIQLIQLKSVISYKNSDSLFIISFSQLQLSTFQVNLKLFDPNQPIQSIHNMKLFHEALNFSDQICLSYDIYKRNFPLKINKITKNGITLQFLNQQSIQIPPYLLGIISFNRVLILNRFNEQLFIGLIQDNSIIKLIYFSNGQPIKQYQFQLPYVFNNNLLNLIEIYQLNLDQIKKSVYQTKKKIIKAIKLNFSIIYLLEDCIKVSIQFTQETFIFEQIQYSFDCTSSFQFYKQEIYIDAHSIIYNHTHYNIIKITLKEKIVQVNNVLQNHFLIFTYYNDQYSAKLFLFQIEEIIHLYTLPTYNYTIQFPIQYKIQMSILMIKVRKADQGFFLLIYDLKNTAVESLIQINAIDEEDNQSFDFIDEKEYFFSYQRQLQIQNLNQPCFFLKGLKEGQDFIEETQLIISTKSEISNENIDLEFHLIIINKNYTLQLLNLSQNILAGEILNQENIFGNIEEVEIIGSENISVYQPLIFNNISAICNFYQFGICIYDKSILRNIFDSNTFIKFSQDFVQLPFYIGFNSEDCSHAIYLKLDESLYMNEFNFCRNNQIQKQNYTISNNAHTMKIFKQINDLQMTGLDNGIILFYFQYKPFLNSVLLNSFINVDFDLFDGAKINDFTYFFLNIGFNVIELKVFNVTQLDHHNGAISDILYQQKYNLNNLFEKSQLIQKNSSKLQIYHVLKINNKFQIKFIIILKDNLAVLMQIILDLNNYNETIFEQLGMIRYENKAIFRKLLFIDLNYVILAFSQDQYRFINIFDINILKNKNIDSIQKFKDDNYNYVERYNESYFIIVEQVNVQEQRVHLITLDKFKIKCHGECSKPSYIKLSNQVSQILIELDFLNEKQINKDKLQSFIVVFTFICIVIRLFCKKEKKRREKQIIQH